MNVVMTVLYQKPHDNPSYETCWFDVRDSNKLDELTAKRLTRSRRRPASRSLLSTLAQSAGTPRATFMDKVMSANTAQESKIDDRDVVKDLEQIAKFLFNQSQLVPTEEMYGQWQRALLAASERFES